jgi:hypothetical protein
MQRNMFFLNDKKKKKIKTHFVGGELRWGGSLRESLLSW